MAEFQPVNILGSYLGGKNARLNEQAAAQRNALAQMDMDNKKHDNALRDTREQRETTKFDQEQKITNTKMINAAAAEVAQNPAAMERWHPELSKAGVIDPNADWRSIPPEELQASAKKLFESTSVALSALQGPKGPPPSEDLVQTIGQDGNPVYTPKSKAAGLRAYIKPEKAEEVPATYREFQLADKDPKYAEYLKKKGSQSFDPSSVETTARLIANNQIPMLSGFALKTPWGQAVVEKVGEINPEFSAGQYGSNAAGLKQFTSGKNGNTIRSLNVAVQHLDQLSQLSEALGNGDIQLINKLSIGWKKQTGQAPPTNFEAAKKIVADEIVKAIVGSGGGVADREEAARSISSAGSPAQLQQAIQTYQGLLTGQLNGIRQQYQTSTGRNDFESLLLPETKARLESHGSQAAATTPGVKEGDTATGPNGQKITLRNGQWVPLGQ